MMSMSMEVEMISLILDDEHVNGGRDGDEGDKGWLPASVVSDNELGDGDGLKGVGPTVNSLILDAEFVNGGGDGAENDGGQPASVVPDDELGDRDDLKGAGLTVNQCCSERWDWQWRRTSRGTGLTILSALFWIMDLIMGIVGRGRDNHQSWLFWKIRLAMEAEFTAARPDYLVSITLDDGLDHGDSVEAAGLTVNQCCPWRWACQWRWSWMWSRLSVSIILGDDLIMGFVWKRRG